MMELNRISSHLVWLATGGMELGALTAMTFGFRERELILDLFELVTGLRMNHAYVRPGGVAQDLPSGAVDKIGESVKLLRTNFKDTANLLVDNGIWKARTEGVGYLDLTGCMALGVTGPILRSTGLPHDLRKSEPYCGYENYDFDVPPRHLRRLRPLPDPAARAERVAEDRRAVPRPAAAGPGDGRGQEDRLAGAAGPGRRRPGQLPGPHPAHHGQLDGGPDPPLQAGHRGLPRTRRAGLPGDRVPARRARRARGPTAAPGPTGCTSATRRSPTCRRRPRCARAA